MSFFAAIYLSINIVMTIQTDAANTCTTCVVLPTYTSLLPGFTLPGLPNLDVSLMLSAMGPLDLVLPVITIPTDPNAIPNYLQQVNNLLTSWPTLPHVSIDPFMQSLQFPLNMSAFSLNISGIDFPFPSFAGTYALPSFDTSVAWPTLPLLPSLANSPYSLSIGKYMEFFAAFVATPFIMCKDILTSLANLSLQMPTVPGVTAMLTGFLTQLGFDLPSLPALTKLVGCFATSIVNLFHQVLGV